MRIKDLARSLRAAAASACWGQSLPSLNRWPIRRQIQATPPRSMMPAPVRAASPITLSWAEGPDGPWHAFATQIENTGRYSWQVPGNVPARVYLRVEAFDLVGNVGSAMTLMPVIIPGGGR